MCKVAPLKEPMRRMRPMWVAGSWWRPGLSRRGRPPGCALAPPCWRCGQPCDSSPSPPVGGKAQHASQHSPCDSSPSPPVGVKCNTRHNTHLATAHPHHLSGGKAQHPSQHSPCDSSPSPPVGGKCNTHHNTRQVHCMQYLSMCWKNTPSH